MQWRMEGELLVWGVDGEGWMNGYVGMRCMNDCNKCNRYEKENQEAHNVKIALYLSLGILTMIRRLCEVFIITICTADVGNFRILNGVNFLPNSIFLFIAFLCIFN